MSRWRRPLGAREVRRILRNLGFVHRNTEGSHEQWICAGPPFRKVTVDPPKAPFGYTLIDSMARQAGVSVRRFYAALDD